MEIEFALFYHYFQVVKFEIGNDNFVFELIFQIVLSKTSNCSYYLTISPQSFVFNPNNKSSVLSLDI